jgi:hypothetical protein
MADKTTIAIAVEVEGVEPSIESIKDLKNAIKAAKDEQVKMANAFGDGSKEYLDATKKLSGLKDKVDDLNDSTKSLKGTGVEQLTQGFSQMKEGIMNLDFDKVKGGIAAMKSGMGAFAASAKTALQGVKGALIATGIGALVVALGLIVAYWDDIKGAIDGVTEEQKKLNAVAKENLTVEQDKLKALEASTNSLKLQGKSEREILELKIKQLDTVYEKAEVDLQNSIQTQLFQVEAEKRNKVILAGAIESTLKPLQLLMSAVDFAGKALGKNFGLAESIKKMTMDSVSGDDAEKEAARKKELDASIQVLKDLKEKRAGYQIAINKIDDDAEKTKLENQKKADAEAQKLRDEKIAAEIAMRKQIEAAFIQSIKNEDQQKSIKALNDKLIRDAEINKSIVDEDLKNQALKASEKTFQNEMAAIYQTKLDKDKAANEKAAADKKAAEEKLRAETNAENTALAELAVLEGGNQIQDLINQLAVKRDIELQNEKLTATEKKLINEKYLQDVDKLNKDAETKKRDDAFKIAQIGLESTQQLTEMFFMFKKNKAEKGSKEELELAKKQFNVQKAFNLAKVAMDGAMAISNIIATTPKADFGVMTAVLLAGSAIATVTNMAKIASAKFDGGATSAPSAGGGASPMPSIPAPPTIATSANNTNQSTLFDENGKNLNQTQPQINVTATVGVDEIANKTNRVSVLEQQSTF